MSEPILEPVVRGIRFRAGLKYIVRKKNIRLVDLGCGPNYPFYKYSLEYGVTYKNYVGIDPLLTKDWVKKEVVLQKRKIGDTKLDSGLYDYVIGFAVLEHMDVPEEVIREAYRILSPGGIMIFSTPTYLARPVLEFLSGKLSFISKREIDEHKHYFDHDDLESIVSKALKGNNYKLIHEYFESFMNNLLVVKKTALPTN